MIVNGNLGMVWKAMVVAYFKVLSQHLCGTTTKIPIKIISITKPSVIKIYLYVYMSLYVSVDNNHHQKANQHRKETTITSNY
jgi:hypothetical protein